MDLEHVFYMIVHGLFLMLVKTAVLTSPVPHILHFPQSSHENHPFLSVSQSHPRQLHKAVVREAF